MGVDLYRPLRRRVRSALYLAVPFCIAVHATANQYDIKGLDAADVPAGSLDFVYQTFKGDGQSRKVV